MNKKTFFTVAALVCLSFCLADIAVYFLQSETFICAFAAGWCGFAALQFTIERAK